MTDGKGIFPFPLPPKVPTQIQNQTNQQNLTLEWGGSNPDIQTEYLMFMRK